MAGYSGTPLPQKLGIKAGARVALVDPPAGFHELLGELPDGASFVVPGAGAIDVAVCFVASELGLADRFLELKQHLHQAGGLWIAWPKRRAGTPAGIGENAIREVGLAAGLVDNKVCAIDERWSGLRFVFRREDRQR
jgi:hypothetical protein